MFILVMAKLNFQQPLLQSSVSRDPSGIGAQVTFLIIIKVKNMLLNIFVETVIHFWISGFFNKYNFLKEQHLFETLLMSLLTFFDQFNASLLNKSIHFFFLNLTDPKCFVIYGRSMLECFWDMVLLTSLCLSLWSSWSTQSCGVFGGDRKLPECVMGSSSAAQWSGGRLQSGLWAHRTSSWWAEYKEE